MQEHYIMTANVKRCSDMCDELQDQGNLDGPSLATITGDAGRGKTEFAKQYATKSPHIYVPPMNKRTPTMLLREICLGLNGSMPYTMQQCMDTIERETVQARRIVFIDEADLLPVSMLEMMRNVNERYGCPVVLIGEKALKSKIGSRKRIVSRIRANVAFERVRIPELVLFYEKALGCKLSVRVAGILHESCGGDWRPLLKTAIAAKYALQANNAEEINEDLARALVNGAR